MEGECRRPERDLTEVNQQDEMANMKSRLYGACLRWRVSLSKLCNRQSELRRGKRCEIRLQALCELWFPRLPGADAKCVV